MKKSKMLKIKISHALYHNYALQKAAVDMKNSLDEISDILQKKTKKK